MDYHELAIESFNTLFLNKVRTGLAMLGVIIGIGSVIALMSLGQASQQSIKNQIQSLGSNLLTVRPGAQRSSGIRGAAGGITTLTYDDAKALKSSTKLTTIKNVSAVSSSNAQITAGRNNTNTQVSGTTPEYQTIKNVTLSSGSFITQFHLNNLSRVAVLGSQTAEDLFGEGVNPVGQKIRIKSIAFKVIGLVESKGGSGMNNQDDAVYIPLTTAQKILFGTKYVNSILVEAKNEEVMSEAKNEIGYFLLDRHNISDAASADFSIMSQEEILSTVSSVTSTFTTLLAGIAAISLVVGGIGIMNIMLVTVTERTREIGLRKALGAKKKWITSQFLIESIIITFVGGFIGIVVGLILAYIIAFYMNLSPTISTVSILLAFGVSTAIGIIFGWYPAQKAANLAPIEALRYE